MTGFLLLLGFLLGLTVGYAVLVRRLRPRFLAFAEYLAFLPGEKAPTTEEVTNRIVRANPYSRPGRPAIGPSEALLLTDVRLHVALVLRSRNPHAFRADRFEPHTEAADRRELLAAAQSLVRLRFVSETPQIGKRHLRLLVHMLDAVLDLGNGSLGYDVVQERFLERGEIQEALRADPSADQAELHLRSICRVGDDHARLDTRGLAKIGIHEIRSHAVKLDERVLAREVIDQAAWEVWRAGALPQSVEVRAFEDTYRVLFEAGRKGPVAARILRVRAA